MSLADASETDIELVARLAHAYVREAWYQSSQLHLGPEQVLAGALLAWQDIKGELPSLEVLERARELAAEHAGSVTTHTVPDARHSTAYL